MSADVGNAPIDVDLLAVLFAVFESTSPAGAATVQTLTIVCAVVLVSAKPLTVICSELDFGNVGMATPACSCASVRPAGHTAPPESVVQLTVDCGGMVLKFATA